MMAFLGEYLKSRFHKDSRWGIAASCDRRAQPFSPPTRSQQAAPLRNFEVFRRPLSQFWLRVVIAALAISAFAAFPKVWAAEKEPLPTDPATGMIMAENWEIVRNHCIICHSPQTFLRQRGTETTWKEIIAWMEKSGGLAPLPAETRETIIAYLTQNYGPGETFRRAPIAATLMPENPYVSEARKEWLQSQK